MWFNPPPLKRQVANIWWRQTSLISESRENAPILFAEEVLPNLSRFSPSVKMGKAKKVKVSKMNTVHPGNFVLEVFFEIMMIFSATGDQNIVLRSADMNWYLLRFLSKTLY